MGAERLTVARLAFRLQTNHLDVVGGESNRAVRERIERVKRKRPEISGRR